MLLIIGMQIFVSLDMLLIIGMQIFGTANH
jgi:hypothetical protein